MPPILTERGTEYCGKVEHHDYQLYLVINDVDHTKTKAMSTQTNGIFERYTSRFCRNLIMSRSVKNYTVRWKSCKKIWAERIRLNLTLKTSLKTDSCQINY
jgi:hypothetical protein